MASRHIDSMFKVFALIVAGIFLMSLGIYSLSVADFTAFQLPVVNWGMVGFVTIAGSIASFGTAFVAIKMT
jgi:hypothetical protein